MQLCCVVGARTSTPAIVTQHATRTFTYIDTVPGHAKSHRVVEQNCDGGWCARTYSCTRVQLIVERFRYMCDM